MADSDWLNRLNVLFSSINRVFTVLVVIIFIFGFVLIKLAPKLDGTWADARLWVVLLLVGGIGVIAITILRLMKTDPARLLEPKVEHTTIQDSEALLSDKRTSD